jgi:hypothetical protein
MTQQQLQEEYCTKFFVLLEDMFDNYNDTTKQLTDLNVEYGKLAIKYGLEINVIGDAYDMKTGYMCKDAFIASYRELGDEGEYFEPSMIC